MSTLMQCSGRNRGRSGRGTHLVNDNEVTRVGEGRQYGRHGREVVAVDDALLEGSGPGVTCRVTPEDRGSRQGDEAKARFTGASETWDALT